MNKLDLMKFSKFREGSQGNRRFTAFRLQKLKREIQLIIDEIEKEDDYLFASISLKLQLFQYQLEISEAAIFDVNGQKV